MVDGNGRPISSYSRGHVRSRKRKSRESVDGLAYNTKMKATESRKYIWKQWLNIKRTGNNEGGKWKRKQNRNRSLRFLNRKCLWLQIQSIPCKGFHSSLNVQRVLSSGKLTVTPKMCGCRWKQNRSLHTKWEIENSQRIWAIGITSSNYYTLEVGVPEGFQRL